MAITLDTVEFEEFIDNPSAEFFLEWATDLFSLATGLTDMPDNPRERRIVTRAIYQMAWYLRTDSENREAYMSEFSSERIGSYSYSKMQKTVDSGQSTSVPAFDFAVDYFDQLNGVDYMDAASVVSENVFAQGFNDRMKPWA